MATPVIMPRQGQSVETCIITKWFRQKGDPVSTGDILFSYETDKAAFDMESPCDGTVLEILSGEGTEVPVLVTVAVIGTPGEDFSSLVNESHPSGDTEKPSSFSEPQVHAQVATVAVAAEEVSKKRISPRARQMALRSGVDYSLISGSGPNGRVISRDIDRILAGNFSKTKPAEGDRPDYTDRPVTNIRKMIARAMHSSLQNSAQLTHHMSADVRKLLGARKKIKESLLNGEAVTDITLNDMICWCVIRALKKHPALNAHFLDETTRSFSSVNLGIAVDTSRGLMVPVVKDAGSMEITELSEALRSVAESCRKGSIDPGLLQSTAASFTVSNLGNYGVEMFTPVINLPQTAILGVCTIINRPADLGNNTFGFIPFIGLSLTYDHRAVDGGPATLFLKEIKEQVEAFSL